MEFMRKHCPNSLLKLARGCSFYLESYVEEEMWKQMNGSTRLKFLQFKHPKASWTKFLNEDALKGFPDPNVRWSAKICSSSWQLKREFLLRAVSYKPQLAKKISKLKKTELDSLTLKNDSACALEIIWPILTPSQRKELWLEDEKRDSLHKEKIQSLSLEVVGKMRFSSRDDVLWSCFTITERISRISELKNFVNSVKKIPEVVAVLNNLLKMQVYIS